MRGFYEQNGYIEYSTAEKMLVNNPKGFLTKELGASGFALRTCYASLSLVQQVFMRAKREHLTRCQAFLPESQGRNLALTVLNVPYSPDSGLAKREQRQTFSGL